MIRRLASKDVVIGSRRIAGGGVKDWSWPRRLVSWGGSVYAKLVLGVPIHDLTGGFNGFRREALETIDYSSIQATGYAFQIEIKYRAVKGGLRVEEMPIVFPDRERGISKMNRRIFSEAVITVLRLRLGR
jgi:dolichol-phosphate mannosyltransferase